MLITTKGLVISQHNVKDNDRNINILTEEYGIVSINVKGALKITGSNNSSTQLFAYSNFCFNERGGRYYLNSSEPIHIFYGIRLDVEKLALACYFAEIASYAVVAEKIPRDVIRLVLNSLYFLENEKRSVSFIKPVFELRFMSETGHLPQLLGCKTCYRHDDDEMYFLIDKAVLLCGEHFRSNKITENRNTYMVSPSVLHMLRYICLVEFDRLFSFKTSGSDLRILSEISEKYILTHLSPSHKFKTLEYYKGIINYEQIFY